MSSYAKWASTQGEKPDGECEDCGRLVYAGDDWVYTETGLTCGRCLDERPELNACTVCGLWSRAEGQFAGGMDWVCSKECFETAELKARSERVCDLLEAELKNLRETQAAPPPPKPRPKKPKSKVSTKTSKPKDELAQRFANMDFGD